MTANSTDSSRDMMRRRICFVCQMARSGLSERRKETPSAIIPALCFLPDGPWPGEKLVPPCCSCCLPQLCPPQHMYLCHTLSRLFPAPPLESTHTHKQGGSRSLGKLPPCLEEFKVRIYFSLALFQCIKRPHKC